MKSYKEFEKICIGDSDIASLILAGCDENGLKVEILHFGGDGNYSAYMVEGEALIGSHYEKVATFSHWLKIYDDGGLALSLYGKEFTIYKAGEYGCIIQRFQ